MKFKNKDRNLLKIVKEICVEKDIEIKLFSENWIIQLKKNNVYKYIFGYNFEVNSSTAQMIAQDKAAMCTILKQQNVPTVEHTLFMNSKIHHYFDRNGNWKNIIDYFNQNDQKIVCKPTRGTGGKNVHVVKNLIDLETTIQKLFSKSSSIALSPFYEIKKEYRVIVLDDEPLVFYSKEIPFIVGDGEKNIYELMSAKWDKTKVDSFSQLAEVKLSTIPELNEKINLHWKHNLGVMAQPKIIKDEALKQQLSALAIKACHTINIRFASVDIVQVGEELMVLEINSGVMGETFSRSSNTAYDLTKKAYTKVIDRMFE